MCARWSSLAAWIESLRMPGSAQGGRAGSQVEAVALLAVERHDSHGPACLVLGVETPVAIAGRYDTDALGRVLLDPALEESGSREQGPAVDAAGRCCGSRR